jgi:hypothetical protein
MEWGRGIFLIKDHTFDLCAPEIDAPKSSRCPIFCGIESCGVGCPMRHPEKVFFLSGWRQDESRKIKQDADDPLL